MHPSATTPAKPSRNGSASGTSRSSSARRNDDPRPKYYVLEMFPYPSGRIHMGHVRNYAMGDVVARYKRAQGLQRAAPDGLGRLRHAGRKRRDGRTRSIRSDWTYANIATMRAQLKSMGLSLDWAREIATCDPSATTSTSSAVPRFPGRRASSTARPPRSTGIRSTMTVLANEQVIDGRGWRSGALVEQRELTQWFFRITDYRAGTATTRSTPSTAGPKRCG